jgi:hypothetical protein
MNNNIMPTLPKMDNPFSFNKKEIEKIIENLWQKAPKWADYIAVDFDGFVFAFENQPYCNPQRGTEWNRKCNATNLNRICSISIINGEFPNWRELIFQRPLPSSLPTTENQLTPLLQRLRDYLDNTPRKQIEADWTQVKSLGLHGSPNCDEFIKTFKK